MRELLFYTCSAILPPTADHCSVLIIVCIFIKLKTKTCLIYTNSDLSALLLICRSVLILVR